MNNKEMIEIKVSDIFTEYFEVVEEIEKLINNHPLLRGRFSFVTTNQKIHILGASKENIYMTEKGLLSLRRIFYIKSEKFGDRIHYRVTKDSLNGDKRIITQICFIEDFVLVSDNEAFIWITHNGYFNSKVYLTDIQRKQLFVLKEFDKDYKFDDEIFKNYISKIFIKIHKTLKS